MATIAEQLTQLASIKSDIKDAIEAKGETVGDDAFSTYATHIGNIASGGGGGGSSVVLSNPLNGSKLGTATTAGTVTHQYQISSGTISNCFLIVPYISDYFISDIDDANFPFRKYVSTNHNIRVSIDNNGLVTVNYNRTQSQVNEYNWEGNYVFGACIVMDDGKLLSDTFSTFGSYSCLIEGTLISLKSGEKKKVEDICYDDELLVWDFDNGVKSSAKPVWIKVEEKAVWYYHLTFSDGSYLDVTGTYPDAHSLFSVDDNKFIHCNELLGKKIYSENGIVTLDKIEEIKETKSYYNIVTDYHLNLFANGILASCRLNNMYPIKDMKFVGEKFDNGYEFKNVPECFISGMRLSEQSADFTNIMDYVNIRINLWKGHIELDANGNIPT